MTKNLVEQAKELKSKRRTNYEITPEVIELALAWQRDEIAIGQIKKVLNVQEPNKIYAILARSLKKYKPQVSKPISKASVKTLGKTPDTAPSKY